MTNTELFNLITAKPNWWKGDDFDEPKSGFCSDVNARKMLFKHRRGELSHKLYAKLFHHYGYIENIHWEEKEK